MSETHVEQWYCCLNDAERLAVNQCASNAGPITYFVVAALIDASFLIAFEGSSAIRREIFVTNWGLTEFFVPPTGPEAIRMYALDPEIWDEIKAYLDEVGYGCAEPCAIRRYSA